MKVHKAHTFVVHNHASRYFNVSSRGDIAGSWLQEEERLLRCGITELLDMFGVVPSYGDNLERESIGVWYNNTYRPTFLPCFTN